MSEEFNEARLRGIDMKKLRQERFTTAAHKRMVALHEEKTKLLQQLAQIPASEQTSKKIAASTKPVRVSKDNRKYQFTDTQIRIAQAVLEQEMKRK